MLNNCVICRNDFEGLGNNAHPVSLYWKNVKRKMSLTTIMEGEYNDN